jgi:phosphatidylinositol alpha-mannosyltransferase
VPFNGSIAPICLDPLGPRAVRNALLEFQPDVVHVHEPFVPGLSMSAVWFASAPVVATFHACCPPSVDAALYWLATRWLRPIGRRIAMRLTVSQAASSSAPHSNDAVHVVPNGIDIDLFAGAQPAPRPSGRTVLFVGRLEPRKGFDVAVRAFTRLCDRCDDVQLVVAGTGPCDRAVTDAPAAVRARIVMLGDVGDGELPSIYAAADVFIAPAVGCESFGTVLLEAMASGRPIVAADIDGYRDVVRADVEALLVAPGNADALADAMGRVLENPCLAERLRVAGRARVEQFAWDVITDAVERAYRASAEVAWSAAGRAGLLAMRPR